MLKECRSQTQRKSHLDNIIVACSRYLDEFNSFWIQFRKSAPHFQRDELVCFAVKDVDLRNLFLRENPFQGSHVIEPVPEEGPQRNADLCANQVVHGGEGRNHHDFADDIFGCKLEGSGASERVSQHAQSVAAKFPTLLFQKSSERAF